MHPPCVEHSRPSIDKHFAEWRSARTQRVDLGVGFRKYVRQQWAPRNIRSIALPASRVF